MSRDDCAEVQAPRLLRRAPHEREHLPDEPRRALGDLADLARHLARARPFLELVREHRREADDRREEVVEVVDHARREVAERLDAPKLGELVLRLPRRGHVSRADDEAVLPERRAFDEDLRGSPVLVANALLDPRVTVRLERSREVRQLSPRQEPLREDARSDALRAPGALVCADEVAAAIDDDELVGGSFEDELEETLVFPTVGVLTHAISMRLASYAPYRTEWFVSVGHREEAASDERL